MSGVVPGIHVLLWQLHKKGIDKAGTLKKAALRASAGLTTYSMDKALYG
jgi:hypothetical protein